MKYAHILMHVTENRWAMHEEKLIAILDFLRLQAGGTKFSADEIEARTVSDTKAKAVGRMDGSIAVLPLRGVIANRMPMMSDVSSGGGTSNEAFGRALDQLLADEAVKAIIIDTDSPGGAVSGTNEVATKIFNARGGKPIIAHVNALAASAAYWIASAADEVVATPSGAVGSIGVFGVHNDLSVKLDREGVKNTLVKAGKFKTAGNPFEPLDDETRARMQSKVDAAYDMFVKDVARNRNVAKSAVIGGYGEGDTLDADRALKEGMIDRIATFDETLARFRTSARAPAGRTAFAMQREKRALALR